MRTATPVRSSDAMSMPHHPVTATLVDRRSRRNAPIIYNQSARMDILLLLFALLLGIGAAIPIGPCQVETVKRAITGHLVASEMVVLGSASADAIYGVIALYGIAPVL